MFTMGINSDSLKSFVELQEKMLDEVDERAREIVAFAKNSLEPMRLSTNGEIDYFEVWQDEVHVNYTIFFSGCIDGDCVIVPVEIWDNPTEENVLNWRQSIYDKRKAEIKAQKDADKAEREKLDRALYEELKAKYGD